MKTIYKTQEGQRLIEGQYRRILFFKPGVVEETACCDVWAIVYYDGAEGYDARVVELVDTKDLKSRVSEESIT